MSKRLRTLEEAHAVAWPIQRSTTAALDIAGRADCTSRRAGPALRASDPTPIRSRAEPRPPQLRSLRTAGTSGDAHVEGAAAMNIIDQQPAAAPSMREWQVTRSPWTNGKCQSRRLLAILEGAL